MGSVLLVLYSLNRLIHPIFSLIKEKYSVEAIASNYPTGPSVGSTRVVRGGFFNRSANFSRCSDRLDNLPGNRNNYIGFRVVRTAE